MSYATVKSIFIDMDYLWTNKHNGMSVETVNMDVCVFKYTFHLDWKKVCFWKIEKIVKEFSSLIKI